MNEDQSAFLHLCQQKETTVDDLKRFCSKNERHFFSSLLNNRPVFHTWLIACCEKSAWSLMFFIFEKFKSYTDPGGHGNSCIYSKSESMYIYVMDLVCQSGNTKCLKNIEKQIWWFDVSKHERRYCYNIALKNNHVDIILILSSWFPKNIYVFPNFHHHYDCYFISDWEHFDQMFQQQKRKKQLFLLWITSNYSPNKNCFLYQLPREISRYLIQQFVN